MMDYCDSFPTNFLVFTTGPCNLLTKHRGQGHPFSKSVIKSLSSQKTQKPKFKMTQKSHLTYPLQPFWFFFLPSWWLCSSPIEPLMSFNLVWYICNSGFFSPTLLSAWNALPLIFTSLILIIQVMFKSLLHEACCEHYENCTLPPKTTNPSIMLFSLSFIALIQYIKQFITVVVWFLFC